MRQTVVVDSETESDSETEPQSEGPYPNNDEESIIENQEGLPENRVQYGDAPSSPPPLASDNVNQNASNNKGKSFLTERYARTEFLVS